MKRFFIKELAILLVLALVIPVLSVAEDIEVDMAEDVPGLESAIDTVELGAIELEDVISEDDVSLDGLTEDSLSDGEELLESEEDTEVPLFS